MSGIVGVFSGTELTSADLREGIPSIGRASEQCTQTLAGGVVTLAVSPLSAQRTAGRSLLHSELHGLTVAFFGELNALEQTARRYGLPRPIDGIGIFLEAFAHEGYDCLRVLDGQFSAVVVNHAENRVSLLQDRIGGFHGFYYLVSNRGLFFSSRLPVLLQFPGLPRSLDKQAVFSLFSTGYVLPPMTLVEGVKKTWPGQVVCFDGKTLTTRVPAQPYTVNERATDSSPDALEAALREVCREIREDTRDASFFLSGGLDSSTLVAIASQEGSRGLPAFSASFSGTPFDESEYAKCVAAHCECDASYVEMADREILEPLPRIIWELDEPFLDFSVLPTFRLCEATRERSEIAVSGDGPDHLFGRHYPLVAKCAVSRLAPIFALAARVTRLSVLRKLPQERPADLWTAYRQLFGHPDPQAFATMMDGILAPGVPRALPAFDEAMDCDLSTSGGFDALFDRMVRLDLLVDGAFGVFRKVGCMSRARDLVVREPFLDRRVLDILLSMPRKGRVDGSFPSLLMSKGVYKVPLKRVLGPRLLPRQVLDKSKGGFTPPLRDWLRDGISKVPAKRVLSEAVQDARIFDLDTVERLFSEHAAGMHDWTNLIFLILSFDIWHTLMLVECSGTPPQRRFTEYFVLS